MISWLEHVVGHPSWSSTCNSHAAYSTKTTYSLFLCLQRLIAAAIYRLSSTWLIVHFLNGRVHIGTCFNFLDTLMSSPMHQNFLIFETCAIICIRPYSFVILAITFISSSIRCFKLEFIFRFGSDTRSEFSYVWALFEIVLRGASSEVLRKLCCAFFGELHVIGPT